MKVKLIEVKEVPDFPSGSGIEYLDEKVYLVGNDTKEILVLDKNWKKLDTISLFDTDDQRLPSKDISDLEATTIVEVNKIPRLMILGSGFKTAHRNKLLLVNLDQNIREEIDIDVFYDRLKTSLDHINIESAAVILGKLVLGNRGNHEAPDNTLVVTDMDFWKHQEETGISTIVFDLPEIDGRIAGLTGLTYSHMNDWLIASLCTQKPGSDSGSGDSYLAVIENASRKVLRNKMKINELINLSEAHEAFQGFRIASVTIQSEKNGKIKLQLAADNDNGIRFLFKIRLKE